MLLQQNKQKKKLLFFSSNNEWSMIKPIDLNSFPFSYCIILQPKIRNIQDPIKWTEAGNSKDNHPDRLAIHYSFQSIILLKLGLHVSIDNFWQKAHMGICRGLGNKIDSNVSFSIIHLSSSFEHWFHNNMIELKNVA